jgi:drug/metabolite transporter (DMT)-like permease
MIGPMNEPAGGYLWIPIVLLAALVQTGRNAAQRSLVAKAGTLGATLSRFLYGLPFALAGVLLLHTLPATAAALPRFTAAYFGWLVLGAVSQLAATACLLAAMRQRNFVVGVAFSKTDALQVAIFGALLLGELPGWVALMAIGLATAGVFLLSLPARRAPAALPVSWAAVVFGLGSGAFFALASVGYRGAALQIPDSSPWLGGAWGVVIAQAVQTLLLGGWLAWRSRASLRALALDWRVATLAGGLGALATFGWMTALALTTAANVRTLGLAEVVFSLAVSHRLREKLTRAERAGLLLVVTGVIVLCAQL